jgi:hypothetical protein
MPILAQKAAGVDFMWVISIVQTGWAWEPSDLSQPGVLHAEDAADNLVTFLCPP